MTRSVTIQFADGTSHTYDNVPDDVTPDQIEARAQGEFKDKQIQHIARAPLEGEAPAEKSQTEKDLENLQSEQIPEAIGYTLGGLGLGYGVAEEGLKGTRNAIKWAERALAGRQPQIGINPNIPAAPTPPGNLTPTQKYGQAMHGGVFTQSPDMSDIYQAGREATQFKMANPNWEVKEGTGLAVPKPTLAEQRAQINAEKAAAKTIPGRLKTFGAKAAETTPVKAAGLAGRILAPAYGAYQLGTQGTKAYNRLTNPQGVGDVAAGATNIVGAGAGAASILPGKYRLPGAIISGLSSAAADALATKRKEEEEKAAGGVVGYASGKQVLGGLEATKKLFAPKPTKIVRASEALGQHEGKRLGLTQTDNFGVHDGRMGGNQFPNFQNISPKHAEDRVVWMNDTEPHANAMVKNSKFGDQDVIWSTYIGAPDQLKSNKTVFNDILENHYKRELTPEQIDLINNRILTMRKGKDKNLVFPQPFDIRDRFAVQELAGDTFDRRAALASMLGEGEGVNKTRSGIALPNYEDILRSHRDPLTEGVPTSSVGTRLFTVDPTPSKFSKEYHPDYEWTVHGEDMGVQFNPVPQNVIVPDWFARTEAKSPGKNRTHGNAWFSYMKDPQEITHDYLMGLEKAGFAEGGSIDEETFDFRNPEHRQKALEKMQIHQAILNETKRTEPLLRPGTAVGYGQQMMNIANAIKAMPDELRVNMPTMQKPLSITDMANTTTANGYRQPASAFGGGNAQSQYVTLGGSAPLGESTVNMTASGYNNPQGRGISNIGAGLSTPIGKGHLSGFYETNPENTKDYRTGVRYTQRFGEGGQIDCYAAGKKVVEAGLKALEPQQTVKAYKLFRTDPKTPESLYPLFVNANKPVPIGQWLPAEAGELTQAGKVKSKIGDLAYRPGWHAGDMPIATHIGGKSSPELTAPDFRPSNQVWAEVEMPADVDWQSVALERAQRNKAGDIIPRTAHITDTIPEGGHYRYKTNPNMTGDWLIGGSMKVNRVLTPEEVMAINEAKGVADLPRFEPLPKKAEGGLMCLKEGGKTPAWQRKEGKNPEGGLNAAGRASYNRETGGNLKAPQPEGGPRRDSFCARMKGMKKKLTSAETANDPDSRINKSLRKWKC